MIIITTIMFIIIYPNHFESLETFIVSKTATQILEVFPADSRRREHKWFCIGPFFRRWVLRLTTAPLKKGQIC